MKLTFTQVERWFGEMMWHLAYRTRVSGMEPSDTYQELLIKVVANDWAAEKTICRHTGFTLPIDPGKVNRFLFSRVRDLARRQSYRNRTMVSLPDTGDFTPSCRDQIPDNEEFDRLVGILRDAMPQRDLDIVMQLAFPDKAVIELAQAERSRAEADSQAGMLRMNVRGELKVHAHHVATHLKVSPATVSRAVKKARSVLEDQQTPVTV